MRRAFAAVAALVLPIALAGGPAAAASHGTPSAADKTITTEATHKLKRQGPDDVCNYTNKRPNLKNGSSGSAVKQAQCYLNYAVDSNLDEDGQFGGETTAAVKDFQRCADIVVDGRVGAQTWSFLPFWANASDAPFC